MPNNTIVTINGSINGLRDVLEFASQAAFPVKGHRRKIYVALDTNLIYRWDKVTNAYVGLSSGSTPTPSTFQQILDASFGQAVIGDFNVGSLTLESTDTDTNDVATIQVSPIGASIQSTTGGLASLVNFMVDSRGASIQGLFEYTDDADAVTHGLLTGYIYRTGNDIKIVL